MNLFNGSGEIISLMTKKTPYFNCTED